MTRKHFGVSLSSSRRDKKFGITSENSTSDIERRLSDMCLFTISQKLAPVKEFRKKFSSKFRSTAIYERENSGNELMIQLDLKWRKTLTHLRLFESQQIKFIIIQCHVHLPKVISNCGWLSILLRVRARCTTLTITERLSRYFIVQNPKIKYFSFLSLIDRQWLKIHKSASKIFSKWSGGAASRKVWRLSLYKKDFWRFLSLIAEN